MRETEHNIEIEHTREEDNKETAQNIAETEHNIEHNRDRIYQKDRTEQNITEKI